LHSAGLDNVSFCNYNSIPGPNSELEMFRLNNSENSAEFMARKLNVDNDYFKVLDIPFDQRLENTFSSKDVIINSRLRKDQSIDSLGFDKLNNRQIVGVVHDFFFNSLYNPIEPIVFTFDSLKFNAALINLPEGLSEEAHAKVKDVWKTFFFDLPFDYVLLDELHANMYHEDISLSKVLLIISISIGTISLVGILSLSSLATIKRLKEFAIRKILGADHIQISFLLMREVGVLFIWAVLISIPAILFFMEYWLSRFAIKIGVNFGLILLIEIIICLLTIAFCLINSRRIVNQNPVTVIRES
jgi:ABC-type antimicrobial peptide transport system permease subunit